jgi:hypothetical protein
MRKRRNVESSIMKPGDAHYMQAAAEVVDEMIPDGHGFILFVAPYRSKEDGSKGTCRYVSTIKRESVVNLLKEWLIKSSGEEEWMRHIK